MSKGIERNSLEVLIGITLGDIVFILRWPAIEGLIDGIRQVAAGVVVSEERAGDGCSSGLAWVPRGEDGRQVVVCPGDGEGAGVEENENGTRIGSVDRLEQGLLRSG